MLEQRLFFVSYKKKKLNPIPKSLTMTIPMLSYLPFSSPRSLSLFKFDCYLILFLFRSGLLTIRLKSLISLFFFFSILIVIFDGWINFCLLIDLLPFVFYKFQDFINLGKSSSNMGKVWLLGFISLFLRFSISKFDCYMD